MSPRTGRPKAAHPRRHTLRVRLTDAEDALVTAAAGEGVEVSPWARGVLLAAAKRELARRRRAAG